MSTNKNDQVHEDNFENLEEALGEPNNISRKIKRN